METRPKTVRLAGSTQTCPCHVCAFFPSKEEEDAVLLPFMAEGFEAGDKLVNIIDERNRGERLQRLASVGIDVPAAERTGQLEIKPWERAHVVGGRFDQQAMLASLDEAAQTAGSSYRLTRLWSNQEWALESVPGVEDLVEYECRFNYIWPKYNDVVVCVYDCTRFVPTFWCRFCAPTPFR